MTTDQAIQLLPYIGMVILWALGFQTGQAR
jgi:hypothetical protein